MMGPEFMTELQVRSVPHCSDIPRTGEAKIKYLQRIITENSHFLNIYTAT